ncbi:nucleic acid-binding protein [Dacryopinax primogenitus]|uniref:Nucleic acid-binding protein n=1 Tax=Dacryopinax primogenitus (strain DJM 731) TaxID=1858805 RepID=M5G959_DACPD|nr:nucleic acid-binding protein [Dacryopinax primogenitus]EJU02407.1 nucleic acid-binding protein [Dacryopinax primogenitus]
MTFHDETGEIDAVAWDKAVDLSERLEIGKLYQIPNAKLVDSSDCFTRTNHWLQVQIHSNDKIYELQDSGRILCIFYDFRRINSLEWFNDSRHVDLVAIIVRLGQPIKGMKKFKDQEGNERELITDHVDVYLGDNSGEFVLLAAFDDYGPQFIGREGEVITIKNALIDKYGNSVSLKTKEFTTELLFESGNHAHKVLKEWFESPGSIADTLCLMTGTYSADSVPDSWFTANIPTKTIKEIFTDGIGAHGVRSQVKVRGTVSFYSDREYTYLACPNPNCNKKAQVAESGNSTVWWCTHCKTVYLVPSEKYRLNMQMRDTMGLNNWITAFNGAMERLFGQYACILNAAAAKKYVITIQVNTLEGGN